MTLTGQGPDRVAIVAPTGREAEAIADLLREDGAIPVVCDGLAAVVAELPSCGLAVLTEEAVIDADLSGLAAAISGQPDWSDLPIVLLTRRGEGLERNAASLRRHMRALGNVTLLERPFHPMTFVSLARTALASRMRQYQARDRLLAIERSQAEIAEGEERLRFVLAAGKLGAWDLHFPERTLSASTLCKTNFGLEPDDLLDYDTFLHLLHPEDRDQVVADAQVAIDTGQAYEVDCRVVTPAGETRWIELRGQATYMAGRPDRIAGVSLDITDRKQAEERQDLLIRELHHRVKNTLSTVQAIIGSTARGAATIDDFYRDFTARIMSLADTHNILTEAIWQKASLHELVSKELKIFDDAHKRIVVSGPEVDLPSDYAVPLGMAFHELTTNAAKYGALSNGVGRVTVSWNIERSAPTPRVDLLWTERGGPEVVIPVRSGFGTRLLDRVLRAQLKATVDVAYHPAGIEVSVSFKLPERQADGAPRGWS